MNAYARKIKSLFLKNYLIIFTHVINPKTLGEWGSDGQTTCAKNRAKLTGPRNFIYMGVSFMVTVFYLSLSVSSS